MLKRIRKIFLFAVGAWSLLYTGATWSATPQVSAGALHTCALNATGKVFCWGRGDRGQLGTPIPTDNPWFGISNAPLTVSNKGPVTAVAAGGVHVCALLANASVECWGFNDSGQFGNGNTINSPTPQPVSGIDNAIAIAAGATHTCALLSTGVVMCWGANNLGQLGDGTLIGSTTPVAVQSLPANVTSISASLGGHACALAADGSAYCWGNNSAGQTGGAEVGSSQPIPARVSAITNAKSIATGSSSTCAVLGQGTVQCWGVNWARNATDSTPPNSKDPVTVVGLSGVSALAAGGFSVCALTGAGLVVCWGNNEAGQLGNGPDALPPNCCQSSALPVSVLGLSQVIGITAGHGHACAQMANSDIQCWGDNGGGQLGTGGPSMPSYVVPFTYSAIPRTVVKLEAASETDAVFNWAETASPQLFGPRAGTSMSMFGYRFRPYNNGHYLGVNESGVPHLFYVGPLSNNAALDLNLLSFWLTAATP